MHLPSIIYEDLYTYKFSGQLPAFIDILGKKLDAADEMTVLSSAYRKSMGLPYILLLSLHILRRN